MKQSRFDRGFSVFVGIVSFLMIVITLYPLYFVVIASLSSPYQVSTGRVFLYPKGFTTEAYKYILRNAAIWRGFFNSTYVTVFGTMYNLFLCIPAAYALSRKNLFARKIVTWFFLVLMYFSGGMIPGYLLVKNIGLLNHWYTLIILSGLNMYNMIITRTFFATSIPEELYESARIDGCGEMKVFSKIALPLAKPIIAVVALFFAVARWNDYFTALIHLQDSKYFTLQLVLRNILITASEALLDSSNMSAEEYAKAKETALLAQTMKYSLILISSFPLLAIYPLVQKHFVKGVMIGAVKG